MSDDGTQKKRLTPRQRKAIAALLSSRDVRTAAQNSNISERTLYRWLNDPTFRAALAEAEGGAIDQATRQLVNLADSAIATLAEVMKDTTAADGVRVRAAQAVLDSLLKLRELRNVEQRLAELEAVVYGEANRQPN